MEAQLAAVLQRLEALEAENTILRDQVTVLDAAASATTQLPRSSPAQSIAGDAAGGPSQSIVDLRLANKPPNGVKSDAQWPTWYSQVTSYLAAVSEEYTVILRRAEDPLQNTLNAPLPAEHVRLSIQLHFILTMLATEGRAADKPLLVPSGEGAALWREIVREFEPGYASRVQSLWQAVMGYQMDSEDLMKSLESFELLCLQYLKAAKKPVPDEVKLGVITGSLVQSAEGSQANKIGEHLLFNAEKFVTYADSRQEIHRIILSKKFFTPSVAVSAVSKGKDGKGGTGLDGKWQKGKGGQFTMTVKFDGACHWCGKMGHKQTECRCKLADRPKNQNAVPPKKGRAVGGRAGRKGQPRGDRGANDSSAASSERCGYCGRTTRTCRSGLS